MALVLNGSDSSATTPAVTGSTGGTGTGIFYPAANTIAFATGGTEDARFNSAGNLQTIGTISVGNATPSTSGAGITFPAAQSDSSNANTLDDYEEGTWTPTCTNAGLTSYTSSGTYTKIGRVVTLYGIFTITNPGTASSGALFTGLPFVNGASSQVTSITREVAAVGQAYQSFVTNTGTVLVQSLSGGGITWTASYSYTWMITYYV